MAAGRVEQVTAIHRVNIMEFRTGLFNGGRYRQVTVIQSGRYSRFDCIYIYIYIYIYNELIEETARHRKLIFGMWEYFGYGSSKF